MLINIDRFIRDFCVRKKDQVLNPHIMPMGELNFPRNSQLHYLVADGDEIGIVATNPILKNFQKGKILCEFVPSYSVTKAGGFREVKKDPREAIQDYFRRNKMLFNLAKTQSDGLQPKNLIVTNYGLMENNITYYNSPLQWWLRFQNRWGSIFETISQKVKANTREHFIVLDLPDILPGISQLKAFNNTQGISEVKKIANSERMLVAQFWMWFGNNPATIIPKDVNVLKRLHFIAQWQGQWICFNLNTLTQFMKTSENTRGSWVPLQMQKNFLAMLSTPQYGVVDNIFLDIQEDDDEVNPLDSAEVKQELQNSIAGFADDDSIKGKLAQAFDKLEVDIDDANDLDKINDKRHKRVDKLLEELDTINADMIEEQESGTEPEEDLAVQPDEAQPASISRDDLVVDYQEYIPRERTLEERFDDKLKEQVVRGNITPQQFKRLEKLSRRYKEIPNPRTGEGTLEVASRIERKDLVISKEKKFVEKIVGVNDDTMLKSTLLEFNEKYIDNVLHKDIFNATLAVQRRGFAITNYEIKPVVSLGDAYEVHTCKITPIVGVPSTISFKVPMLNKDGTFMSRSIKMSMCKQRVDIPIRKIGPAEVALTSYMSKMFVERCTFAAYSKETWLKSNLVDLGSDNNGVQVSFGSVFHNDQTVPLIYSQIARTAKRIRFKDYDLNFDVSKLSSFFGQEVVDAFEPTRGTQILLGKGKNTLLVLSKAGVVHECSINNDNHVDLGPLEDFIGLESVSAPKDCADLVVVSKNVPIGVVLGYYLGLGNLLKTLDVTYRVIPRNARGESISPKAIVLAFADQRLVIDQYDYRAQLVLQGFNRYHKHIKQYQMVEFDKKTVYGAVFADAGLPARFMREFNILRDMWIDPITEAELRNMGEPTDLVMLFLRAVEMLEIDVHPEAMDRAYQRDRGYERISGMVYEELVKAIRAFDSTPVPEKAKLSLNPEAVWMALIGDETTAPIEESNPIHSLKEQERVVYRGAGGRGSRTMNSRNRMFSATAIGVDSESTVDNGDAGTVRFLTANPNYNSLRGTVDILDKFDQSVNSTCLGTSVLLAPAIELDDPKRRSFCVIQNSRTTNSEGSQLLPCRTGYEYALPYRTSDLYATMATEDGTITRVTDTAVVFKGKSGKETVVELGKRDGKWSGKIIPHEVITDLKEGQKVKVGQPIAYNPLFFTKDNLTNNLAYKMGVLARIGLIEDEFTYEDSSELYAGFVTKLRTKNSEPRFIEVRFDQNIHELVKVGSRVSYDTILCILRDNISGFQDNFVQDSLESLRDVSSSTPRAKHSGVVTNIKALYVGDVENMSPTLQQLVSKTDRDLYKKARDLNKERVSGQKKVGDRYEGKTLSPDTVLIEVTIDITQEMGIGSKVVHAHQMKSVVSNVYDEPFATQDGVPYDGKFSYTSNIKRIVESSLLIGVVNTFCIELGRGGCDLYERE